MLEAVNIWNVNQMLVEKSSIFCTTGSTSHMTLLADVDIACQKRFEKYVMIVIEVWLDRSDVSLKTYQKYRQLLLGFGF